MGKVNHYSSKSYAEGVSNGSIQTTSEQTLDIYIEINRETGQPVSRNAVMAVHEERTGKKKGNDNEISARTKNLIDSYDLIRDGETKWEGKVVETCTPTVDFPDDQYDEGLSRFISERETAKTVEVEALELLRQIPTANISIDRKIKAQCREIKNLTKQIAKLKTKFRKPSC